MTYRMDDGTVVKTENATQHWQGEESEESLTTETLYRSRRGRYWLEHLRGAGSHRKDYAEWISNHAAAQWLLGNGHELPEDLAPLAAEVEE